MKTHRILGLVAMMMLAAACGGSKGEGPKVPGGGQGTRPSEVTQEAKAKFEDGLNAMTAHDSKADWSDATCTQVAQTFLAAVEEQKRANKPLPEGHYNAGLAYQRCGKDAEAKAQFQAALGQASGFHRAKVQLALYEYKEKGDAVLDQTIQKLQDAVVEAKFQNVDALVNLAMLQMRRGGPTGQQGCSNDMECAKLNIQRALAIDDGFMPAFNQLALYYLNEAHAKADKKKKDAGRKGRRALVAASGETEELSGQMLDLAALVCSQAIRKNAKYAPIYNTLGLIQVEQKNINNAVQAFNTARTLDPNFFEAQMNYAAVNLSFRGFDQAEAAYRQALKMRPDSYEAQLGLALAIRGQINDSNWDKNLKDAQAALDRCKQLQPSRAEAYFNEAILVQEYKAKSAKNDDETIRILEQAKAMFSNFIQKAGASPEFADAVKNSKDRQEDIDKMIEFIKQGKEEERKAREAAAAASARPAGSAASAPAGSR